MIYTEFHNSVLVKVNLARGYSATRTPRDDGRTDRVIAAAAVVLSERGPQWCLDNPKGFTDAVQLSLGTWVKIGIALAGLFTGGGSIWISLIGEVIPAVLELLQERLRAVASVSDRLHEFQNAEFAGDARVVLEAK